MGSDNTEQIISSITDEGLFERLVTAVLRESNPSYSSIVHTGVNTKGKTVKSPIDGICFVRGAKPPHMIIYHHTTTARNKLYEKWLYNTDKAKHRNNKRSKIPSGDFFKATTLAKKQRLRIPNLSVTLVLTTNQEPDEELVRNIETEGLKNDIGIDLWPCSRISHFLDINPDGQWIRQKYLGINQELLSSNLLFELSKKSLETYAHEILADHDAWVSRDLDTKLGASLHRRMTFLVANSGMGKSVACYRQLAFHIKNGGFGIVLPHNIVGSEMTLEQAITKTLFKLHPPLATIGPSALSLCSFERQLLIIVDDISKSREPRSLVEKLIGWNHTTTNDDEHQFPNWCLICSLWPEVLISLGEQAQKYVEQLIIIAKGFTESESCQAVLTRAKLTGRNISLLDAEMISRSLGYDPLLISLNRGNTTPNPFQIIGKFVEDSISRIAVEIRKYPAADFRRALRTIAAQMLIKRRIELVWDDIISWPELNPFLLQLISSLAHNGEIIRFTGLSNNQHLSFRHDRVRDWLLADAAAELYRQNRLNEAIFSDPYFAETIGSAYVYGNLEVFFANKLKSSNPLALFHALRLIGATDTPPREHIIQAIKEWLDNPEAHDRSNTNLRYEALIMLSETDSPESLELINRFHDKNVYRRLGQFHNGDIFGGIRLCYKIPPFGGAPWRDKQIEHEKLSHGLSLINSLIAVLLKVDLDTPTRVGALHLAGHFADSKLAPAIETCWNNDNDRSAYLESYLWAFGECCGDNATHYLAPVIDAWARISDQPVDKDSPSPRDELAEYSLRFAFNKWPPVSAIDYFVQRGAQDDLKWPITLLLRGIDHPSAISFMVRELADIQRRAKDAQSFSPFVHSVKSDWQSMQENGQPMSIVSRNLLLGIWENETNDEYLREQAFLLWSSTRDRNDIVILKKAKVHINSLSDRILMQRLILGDKSAIPKVIRKISKDENGYWLQCGRYIWSMKLTEALDNFLIRRGDKVKLIWGETINSDSITHLLIKQLPEAEAERLLIKHWSHLRFSPYFVQAALFISTPRLKELVKETLADCPEPKKLMERLSFHYGILFKSKTVLSRKDQIYALAPYLNLLSGFDVAQLWNACNKNGWFDLRKKLLDNVLEPAYQKQLWSQHQALEELDKMLSGNWTYHMRIIHWVDEKLKSGVKWSEILETLKAWLDKSKSIEALKYISVAIEHSGTREDLSALKIYENMPQNDANNLIANTRFFVYRNTIR